MGRLLFTLMASVVLYGQDLGGQWQGTIKAGGQDRRVIVQLSKSDAGAWTGSLYRVDEFVLAFPVSGVSTDSGALRFSAPRGSFEGKLSADGNSATGTLTDGEAFPLVLRHAPPEAPWPTDITEHTMQFVTVDKDVKLEVIDWGGSGRPLVMLTGLGDNAHIYDRFAPKLAATYHVYGITRRGFGASSKPETGYESDRLGDDVLAVLDALKLNKPVLVGHSIAGVELSSIGSRHPERVAGLVYLDSAYDYAFYDPKLGAFDVDMNALRKALDQLRGTAYSGKLIEEMLGSLLPNFERDLREEKKYQDSMPPAVLASQYAPITGPAEKILAGEQKYTQILAPALAIFALPHDLNGPPMSATEKAAYEARDLASTGAQATAFEKGVPGSRVVRLAGARHYVFRSNEAEVLREVNSFIERLP